jgi:hypothetical protein
VKKGTPRHPKTKRLARALKVKLYAAVGILEMLWHYTAEYYPAGDIGRATDEDIAEAVCWDKDSDALIRALQDGGWVDGLTTEHRLIVHDWPHHAEDAVHLRLARAQKYFADGSAPKYTRLSGDERKRADAFFGASCVEPVRTPSTSSASEASQTGQGMAGHGNVSIETDTTKTEKPSTRARVENAISAAENLTAAGFRDFAHFESWYKDLYAGHPTKGQYQIGMDYLRNHFIVKCTFTRSTFEEIYALHRKSRAWTRDGGRAIPKLSVFVQDDGCSFPPTELPEETQKKRVEVFD